MMTELTPNSPQVFATQIVLMVLLCRQLEAATISGDSAEAERVALLKASRRSVVGVHVANGDDDGRTEEFRRQIDAMIVKIFEGVSEHATGLDALLERVRAQDVVSQ
jgi:hypothetical protein